MENKDFTLTVPFDKSPTEVFNAINNVRGWWSENIKGGTEKLNDEFDYNYQDMHRCRIRVIESIPGRKVVWLVLDNYFSFTKDESEWKNTEAVFDISEKDGKTILRFTHQGLTPEYECYDACVNGWTQYVQHSLPALVATGQGQPNSKEKAHTTYEVALRFSDLAREEKWFEIQDELFADDVKSIDPVHSPYFGFAEGKAAVRKKGEDWVKRIEAAHKRYTSEPLVAGNHFAVKREVEITVKGHGRIHINEIMLYEVKDGRIISEQFFY